MLAPWRALRGVWVALAGSTVCWIGQPAQAAGPAVAARADWHLWGQPIGSLTDFDRESRAAILVYVGGLSDVQKLNDAELQAALGIQSFDRRSVDRWLAKTWNMSVRNYRIASGTCGQRDWTCGARTSTNEEFADTARLLLSNAPAEILAWKADMVGFVRAYIGEQLKLAAIFPSASSEVDLFNDREWNGDDLPDRQFFLTFDDGPTAPHGTTDEVVKLLQEHQKSATFFLLGTNLRRRINSSGSDAVTALYGNQCVANHGWEHHSHAKWDEWQDSVVRTNALIRTTIHTENALPLFRPPYGQRKPDSEAFFRSLSLHVALWNVDSLDWNNHVGSSEVAGRVLALMLIKRHGVLLFHDIHPKAAAALQVIFRQVGPGVSWGECHRLG